MKKKDEQTPQDPGRPVLPKEFFKQFKNKEEFKSFFNDLFKQGVEEMLQAELDEFEGFEQPERELGLDQAIEHMTSLPAFGDHLVGAEQGKML